MPGLPCVEFVEPSGPGGCLMLAHPSQHTRSTLLPPGLSSFGCREMDGATAPSPHAWPEPNRVGLTWVCWSFFLLLLCKGGSPISRTSECDPLGDKVFHKVIELKWGHVCGSSVAGVVWKMRTQLTQRDTQVRTQEEMVPASWERGQAGAPAAP